jgi:hypothetical protein
LIYIVENKIDISKVEREKKETKRLTISIMHSQYIKEGVFSAVQQFNKAYHKSMQNEGFNQ